jgi:hypothetical protein
MSLSLRSLSAPIVISAVLAVPALVTVPAPAGPLSDAAEFVATNLPGAAAEIGLRTGTFVLDATSGVVRVVDAAGQVLESIAPAVLVDGVQRRLTLTISDGGRTLAAAVEGGLQEGAVLLAAELRHQGVRADACAARGLPTAVLSGLVAALAGGLSAVLAGPMAVVTNAAVSGLAGAFAGFLEGCVKGLWELDESQRIRDPADSAHPDRPGEDARDRRYHTLDQVRP